MSGSMVRAVPGLFLTGVALAFGGCGAAAPEDAADAAPEKPRSEIVLSADQIRHGGITWAAAEASIAAAATELPGQLVPDDDATARLGAPAEAQVAEVHVVPGEAVRAGAALVTLRGPAGDAALAEDRAARAELASRRVQAELARTWRERAERLLEAKVGSRQELERARAEEALALALHAQAEAEAERAAAALRRLGVEAGGVMVLRAPIAGIVLTREAAPGMVVPVGSPLVAITNPKRLWLELLLTERAAAGVRPGAPVHFVVPSLPADTFEAKVTAVGGGLQPSTRTLLVRAAVENRDGRLRPGSIATARVQAAEARPVMLVHSDAVQRLDGETVVFIVNPKADGGVRLERRRVEPGGVRDGKVEILAGLNAGDVAVVQGAFAVKSEFSPERLGGGGE